MVRAFRAIFSVLARCQAISGINSRVMRTGLMLVLAFAGVVAVAGLAWADQPRLTVDGSFIYVTSNQFSARTGDRALEHV